MEKQDYQPLLPAGFHHFDTETLQETFVTPFAESTRRALLLAGLLKFVSQLKTLAIKGELWFDGSFATSKSDPDDIDLVVIFERESVEALTTEQQQQIQQLLHQPSARAQYNCDVYCTVKDDANMVSYWRGWFGFKRDGKTPKGIGLITL